MNLDRDKGPHHGEHSKKKGCCCGGHNASNAKKSLSHHSTLSRLKVRRARKFTEAELIEAYLDD